LNFCLEKTKVQFTRKENNALSSEKFFMIAMGKNTELFIFYARSKLSSTVATLIGGKINA